MEKLNPDLILYIFLFLIPGFLVGFWLNLFLPLRPGSDHKNTMTYLLWSATLALPWILVQGWKGRLAHFHSFSELLWFVLYLLVAPLLVALVLEKVVNNPDKYPWKAFQVILRVRTLHPIPSAWDKTFLEIENSWIQITLKDGTRLGGIWDASAIASTDPAERDIFLRRPFKVDSEGHWNETAGSLGILVKADQIALVEFFKDPGADKEIENAHQ